MNILMFSTHVLWPSHYETELELIQFHIDKGHHVTQVVCNRHLGVCDLNHYHKLGVCLTCILKRAIGRTLLSKKIPCTKIVTHKTNSFRDSIFFNKDIDYFADLLPLCVDNFDIGYAVGSSLISWLRDPYPDIISNKNIVKAYLKSSLMVYRSTQYYLDTHKIDRVYVFNGRYAHARAILRACQSRNVECFVHERGHNIHTYALYENVLPHNIANAEKQIRLAWKIASSKEREVIGKDFFEKRAQGVEQSWYSFVKAQKTGLLPKHWVDHDEKIVVFNSSEDEFASIGEEWKNTLYANQLEGMEKILESLEVLGDLPIHIYLRMHPNNKGLPDSELSKWKKLHSKYLTIIPPESEISTYALVKEADKVLTFGSTVGIEAVFWGKPSILAGPSFYRNLGATYNPSTHEELIQLLRVKLDQKDKVPALMYGYYMSTFGVPFNLFKANGFDKGTFNGFDLNKSKLSLIYNLIKRMVKNNKLNT